MPPYHPAFPFIIFLLSGYAHADSGDDFSNNLFSDLAPILALFGERVTMQFMSQSISLADCIILAMAPLGIITIIVSAIRVGGPVWLQAIIGRARENLSAAEMELMSSTSEEVCELYNGQTIVRCEGSAKIWEFICLFPKDRRDKISSGNWSGEYPKIMAMELNDAKEKGLLIEDGDFTASKLAPETLDSGTPDSETPDLETGNSKQPQEAAVDPDEDFCITIIRDTSPAAPNISLNHHSTLDQREINPVAIFGTVLQLGVLVFFGLITYHPTIAPNFQKDDEAVAAYAFPATASGTVLLVLGMFICAYVVNDRTEEHYYKACTGKKIKMIWLQKEQTVSDQAFKSFATYPSSECMTITTSRRRVADSQDEKRGHKDLIPVIGLGTKTVIGTVIGLLGFVTQFIGLRGMNWSATVAQLGAVCLMTVLRAWIRRGFAKHLGSRELTSNFELDWLAMNLRDLDTLENISGGGTSETDPDKEKHMYIPISWIVNTGRGQDYASFGEDASSIQDARSTGDVYSAEVAHSTKKAPEKSIAQRILMTRHELSRLADWRGIVSMEAVGLATVIETAMNTLFPPSNKDKKSVTWFLDVSHLEKDSQKVLIQLSHDGKSWKVLADEIESVLSLWIYSIRKQEKKSPIKELRGYHSLKSKDGKDKDEWLRAKGPQSKSGLRLLGPKNEDQKMQLIQDLKWWIPGGLEELLEVKEIPRGGGNNDAQELVEKSRVVGCGQAQHFDNGRGNIEIGPEKRAFLFKHITNKAKDNNKGGHRRKEPGEEQSGQDYDILAIKSFDPLEKLYSKDLLYAFMCSAASTPQSRIESKAETRPTGTGNPNDWKSVMLWNKDLEDLAREFQNNDFGTQHEAYLSIISPLSMAEKLPYPQAIFDLVREKATEQIREEGLEGAADSFLWLWGQIQCFHSSRTDIWTTTFAFLLEYLYLVIDEISTRETEGLASETLVDVKNELEEALTKTTEQEDTFESLMRLYREQGRPWERLPALLQDMDQNDVGATQEAYPERFKITELHLKAMRNGDFEFDYSEKSHVYAKDICGWTPLHYVAARGSRSSAEALWYKTSLVDYGFLNTKDLRDWTPLHYTCWRGKSSIVEFLLQRRASIDAQGIYGVSPLHCAARSGNLEVIELLKAEERKRSTTETQLGICQRLRDYNGRAPIHWAVVAGHARVVEALKADIELQDRNGWTPLHLAVLHDKSDVIETLLNRLSANTESVDKKGRTPLILAAEKKKWEALEKLNQAGANVNAADLEGCTPLHSAVSNGADKDIIQMLIENGAKVDAAETSDKWTPLHYAGLRGDAEVMEILLNECPTAINGQSVSGWTPIHVAALGGEFQVVKLLIDRKADVNIANNNGDTPLHIVAFYHDEERAVEVAQALVKGGVLLEA